MYESYDRVQDAEKRQFFYFSFFATGEKFCTRAMWIEGGNLVEYGDDQEVCEHYAHYLDEYNALSKAEKKTERDEKFASAECFRLQTDETLLFGRKFSDKERR